MQSVRGRRSAVVVTLAEGFVALANTFHVPMKLGPDGNDNVTSALATLHMDSDFSGVAGAGNKVDMRGDLRHMLGITLPMQWHKGTGSIPRITKLIVI